MSKYEINHFVITRNRPSCLQTLRDLNLPQQAVADRKRFHNSLTPLLKGEALPYLHNEPRNTLVSSIARGSPQLTRYNQSLNMQTRLSLECDREQPLHKMRVQKQSHSKSPEQILMKYGIINPKFTKEKFIREHSYSEEKNNSMLKTNPALLQIPSDTYYTSIDTLSDQKPNKAESQEEDLEPRRKKSGLKRLELPISPFTVTKKQLNYKYNYINLESLEKEESFFFEMAQKKLKQFQEKKTEATHQVPTLREYRAQLSQHFSIERKGDEPEHAYASKTIERYYSKIGPHLTNRLNKQKMNAQPGKRKGRAFTPWKEHEEEDLLSIIQ